LAQQPKSADKKEEEVSPAEDLMREHGVLNRVLLIYDEILRRLKGAQDFDRFAYLCLEGWAALFAPFSASSVGISLPAAST
jgi:hypothetical protein